MEIGGAERALLGLLNAIDTSRVDVDLFINQHTGEFMPLISEKINLLPENKRYSTIERPMSTVLKEGHFDIVMARIFARLRHWLYRKWNKSLSPVDGSIFDFVSRYTTLLLPSLRHLGKYDLAISFLTPHRIVKEKVNATKKIAWIHTDYSVVSVNEKAELPVWNSYDHIISISSDVTSTFLQTFPSLKHKIIEIENILSPAFVKAQALLYKPQEYSGDFIKICSVGRFCDAKNYENIPFVSKILKDHGLRFKWFIIGYGDSSLTKQSIKMTQTEDCVILLGKKDNPYPYIANCDIYAQPSRYEGKSVTVREAQILCRPTIVTNYPTATSQITNGKDGIICNMDNESIANAIYNLATDKTARLHLSTYLSEHDYGNESEICKIYRLIENYG